MVTRKPTKSRSGDLRPEYDISQLEGGVRGRFFARARAEGGFVLLDPELSKIFPTSESVREALRTLVAAARSAVHPVKRTRSKPA